MRTARPFFGALVALVAMMLVPSAAFAFTALRPTVEATQNAYGLWYAPAKSCGQEGCHDIVVGKPTVHGNMVTIIPAKPDKLLPQASSSSWPAPDAGGRSLGPSDIYLQIGDNKGFLEYAGFPGAISTNPTGDLPLWNVLEWVFGEGWVQPTAPVGARAYSQSCSPCHNTGVTRPSNATFTLPNGSKQTTATPSGVVEFSIGCQVCHGSGQNDAMHARNVPRVVGGVQVLRAQVCGQCHVSGAAPQKNVTGGAFGNPNGYTTDENLSDYLTAYTNVPTEVEFAAYVASLGTPKPLAKPRFLPNGANFSLRHSYYNEWLINKAENGHGHADPVNPTVVLYNEPKCLGCHSGLGFLNRIGAKAPNGSALVPNAPTVTQADTTDVGISCQVCHTGHVGYNADGSYDDQRRWASGKKVGCGDCHNWQFEVLGQPLQHETISDSDEPRPAADSRVRHPEREMREGVGLWGVPTTPNPMPGVECQDCHMPRTHKEDMPANDNGDEEATRASHRFHVVEPGDAKRWRLRPGGDSCVAECHSGERKEYTRDEFQLWIDAQRALVDDRTDEATAALGAVASDLGLANWTAFMAARPAAGAGAALSAAEWSMLQKAAQNVDYVINDASHGIHNPDYAIAGLMKATQWARSLKAALSLTAGPGFVDGESFALTASFSGPSGSTVVLEASHDGGQTWTAARSITTTSAGFLVDARPVVGQTTFRLAFEPADGVRYTSSNVNVVVPSTTAATLPQGASATWVDGSVTITLAGTPGSLTAYSLTGATTRAASAYIAPIIVSAEGVTMVNYWSADALGRETTRQLTIRIDRGAPAVYGDVKPIYAERADILLSGTDEASGVVRLRYALDSGVPVAVNAATARFEVASLGTHTLSLQAQDVLGHWSETRTWRFSVKATPRVTKSPTASISSVRRGAVWRYGATIRRQSGARIAWKRVALQRSTDGRTWRTYVIVTSNRSGWVSRALPTGTRGTTYWRWRVVADSRYNAANGSVTKLNVR